jgi:Icc-related predicted phosphoesterase
MKILAVSDQVVPSLHSPLIRERFGDVDIAIGCGDLPYSYMEYIATVLGVPCLYVHGNHDRPEHLASHETLVKPGGWVNLDGRTVQVKGLILGGIEGSMRYQPSAPYQYTEHEVALRIWRMSLSLYRNRLFHGRYLDILVTHAPPCGIHDDDDLCHRGFQAYLRFIQRFRPRYLLHGHVHAYGPTTYHTRYLDTEVINVFPFRVVEFGANHVSGYTE